jgi:hypothetical protein
LFDFRTLSDTLLSLQPQVAAGGEGESKEEKVKLFLREHFPHDKFRTSTPNVLNSPQKPATSILWSTHVWLLLLQLVARTIIFYNITSLYLKPALL